MNERDENVIFQNNKTKTFSFFFYFFLHYPQLV